jgi:hypothetical protein
VDLGDKWVLYHPVGDVLRRIEQRAAEVGDDDSIAALRMDVMILFERIPDTLRLLKRLDQVFYGKGRGLEQAARGESLPIIRGATALVELEFSAIFFWSVHGPRYNSVGIIHDFVGADKKTEM